MQSKCDNRDFVHTSGGGTVCRANGMTEILFRLGRHCM